MSDHKTNCVEAKKAADISNGGCGVCERLGFPLFLVRKSVVKKQLNGINWSAGIPSLNDREPEETLKAHEYVLRTLRTGYVYVLVETKLGGNKEFLGYEVTPDGAFRYRTVKEMHETDVKPLAESCVKNDHTLPSLFINVDMSIHKETVWVAYSRRAWSEKVRLKYTSADADLTRFTQVTINDGSKAEPAKLSPGRSFDFDKLINGEIKLLEFENETLKGKFDTAHNFNSLAKKGTKDKLNNIAAHLAKKNNCKVGVVLVEDTFGLAEEFNKQRLINCEPLIMPAWEQAKLMDDNIQKAFKDYAENTDAMGNKRNGQSAIDSYMDRALDGKLPLKKLSEELFKVFQNPPNTSAKLTSARVPDYFKQDLVYRRKIMSCINGYKSGLQDYFDEKFTQPQYRDFSSTTGDPRGDAYNAKEKARLLSEGWEEVTLPPTDKVSSLTPKTRLVLTPEKAAEFGFKKEWEKLQKRLSTDKLDTFEKDNNAAFKRLLSEIEQHNYDYLMYVTWLFGSESKPSTEAIKVKRYNSVEFWLIECESDGLDAHKGYIDDAIAMLKGNVTLAKLPEQYAIWDSLMRNDKTFYFHVLSGGEKSLWSWLLQEKLDDNDKTQEKIGDVSKGVDTSSQLADIPYHNKTLFIAAFEELVGWSVAGIANGPESAKRINSALMKGHFEEAVKAFSNIEARRFTFNARIRDLPEIYRAVMSTYEGEKSVSVRSGGQTIEVKKTSGNWEIQGNHSSNVLNNKIKIEMVLIADDFASMQHLEQFLTAHKNSGGGMVNSSSLVQASQIDGAQMRVPVELARDLTADEMLNAIKQVRRRAIIAEGKAAVINGIMVLLQMLSFNANRKLLQQQQLPKAQHDKIVASMAKALLTSGIMISQMGAQLVKVVGVLRRGGIFSQMIPGASSFIKGTGVVLAGVAILDGIMDVCSGIRMIARGDGNDGVLVFLGGVLGILSGSILLYFAVFVGATPIGWLLFAIGLALLGAYLVATGSESDNWSPIELWFNRCLFGKHDHTEKGVPYQATEADVGKAINDYFACISGSYLFVAKNMSEKKLVNAIHPEVPWYVRISDSASGNGNPVAADAISRDFYGSLYLLAGLSQYTEKSTFEGEVIIECYQGAPIRLTIEKAADRVKFIPVTGIPEGHKLLLAKEASDAEKHTYGISEKNKGIFTIEQKIGEISGLKQLYCFLNYWAEGKEVNSMPMRLEYQQQG
ncbi:T6SS effector BTH_I2691 family protein [Limnobaculum parvum]|uniref:Toxin VasX N-terminal region domain-containing protein n=1 Tax=Limnobaculum parvum TaxID=2172103 RepID=A0A2Y9TUH6_9GAMM|nr:T6SS effector BTH_I2691 family protein [Limnobaculum parvum]AWH87231.1 hypothetical protein HYN51_00855 [Limnobaculum parvum]